jgi:cytochrome d ubiquinol oxidase subunit I
MELDVVILSRLQFALTIMFHYLFPPLTIGLGLLMVWAEGSWLWTRDQDYRRIARFWSELFAVNFALGVVTGVVMEFEFGTNWANYSRFVGDVFGSGLAAEGLFAFFMESGFLGVVLFGWHRVPPKVHFFATCMVSLGGFFSSVWILVANSFMQTPVGYHIVGEGMKARAEVTDFWTMVLSPSLFDRLAHVWLGAFIVGAFFALSIAAYYILRNRHTKLAKKMLTMSLVYATLSSTAMLLSGDSNARMVAEHQPAKLAALEGHFETGKGPTPLMLFGIPNEKEQTLDLAVGVPGLLTFLVYRNWSEPVAGLDQFPPEDRPPVWIPFVAYRIMVGAGTLFIGITWLGIFFWWRGTLFKQRWLMFVYSGSIVAALAANEAGWVCTEVGRQPWIVYGLLRTTDGISETVQAGQVLGSIIMFGLIYLMLFAVWLKVLYHKIEHGPPEKADPPSGSVFKGALASIEERHNDGKDGLEDDRDT